MDGQDFIKIIEVSTLILNILWKLGKSIFNFIKITLKCLIIIVFFFLIYKYNNFFTNIFYIILPVIIIWTCPPFLNMSWKFADFRDLFRFFKKEKDLESFGLSAMGWLILVTSLGVFYKVSQNPEFRSFTNLDLSGLSFFFLLCFCFIARLFQCRA